MGHYPKSEQIKKEEKAYEKNILYGTQRSTSGREHACLCGGGITVHENTAYLYGKGRHNGIYQGRRSTALDVPIYIKDGYTMLPLRTFMKAALGEKSQMAWIMKPRRRQ